LIGILGNICCLYNKICGIGKKDRVKKKGNGDKAMSEYNFKFLWASKSGSFSLCLDVKRNWEEKKVRENMRREKKVRNRVDMVLFGIREKEEK
jgi:hypothetical protein